MRRCRVFIGRAAFGSDAGVPAMAAPSLQLARSASVLSMEGCTGRFKTAMPEPCRRSGYWPWACAEHAPEALSWLRYGVGLAWLRARVYLVCNNAGSIAPAAMHDLLSGGCRGHIVMPWAGVHNA